MLNFARGLGVILLCWGATVGAQSPPLEFGEGPKFGPEFTTYSKATQENKSIVLEKFAVRAKRHLVDGQFPGARFDFSDQGLSRNRFQSPNGWAFQAKTDNGVLEFVMDPMTFAKYELYSRDIQDAIFVTAANEGHFPALFLGGGHISIDNEYLFQRPMLYRNFLADLIFNHVELFMGVFGYDTNNAVPPVMLGLGVQKEILAAFEEFDRSEEHERDHIVRLVRKLQDVFEPREVDGYQRYWNIKKSTNETFTRSAKFFALSVQHAPMGASAGRIELRAVRPQASIDVWIRQIRLLHNRLKYLNQFDRPIPLKLPFDLSRAYVVAGQPATGKQALNPPIQATDALANFKIFVEESGEKIEDHLDYVWPSWQMKGGVTKFIKSLQAPSHCESLLENAGAP